MDEVNRDILSKFCWLAVFAILIMIALNIINISYWFMISPIVIFIIISLLDELIEDIRDKWS